ncbi:MAG: class I SAM-dependent methyltransferase [Nitrospirae bacterium]|nr:class I SAM-dependent methyltransferase [Nitrospirota bacterium]
MEGSWTGPGGGGFREYWLAAFLSKELELKSILLFGTGNTITFRRLKEEGYNVAGCDITPELVESRKKEFGDDSFFYPHMMPQDRRFDIIICVEVFEHFVEPRQSFNYLTSILSDNGIICGTTNFYLGGSIVDSNNPGYMSHIRHIIYWSKESLKNIAKQYNLETSCFEMISPGSVIPDEKFGQLWPNKRVFFLHKAIYNDFFSKLFLKNPILPIDKP